MGNKYAQHSKVRENDYRINKTGNAVRMYGSCLRKKRHSTRNVAEEKAYLSGKKHGIKLYVYQCSECGYFHLTKEEQ